MAENNPVGVEDNSIAPATIDRQRDEKGKFKPKPNPEFTLPHFWLECFEICIGILMAQIIWEGGIWLIK